jgi:uncharacterized protein (TIGR00369 family)
MADSVERLDAALGLVLEEAGEGRAIYRLDPEPVAVADGDPPFLHGGALATVVDSAAWAAVASAHGDNWLVVDLRVDFLRLGRAQPHRVTATVRRAGRRLAVADVEIAPEAEPDRPVALGRVTLVRSGG